MDDDSYQLLRALLSKTAPRKTDRRKTTQRILAMLKGHCENDTERAVIDRIAERIRRKQKR